MQVHFTGGHCLYFIFLNDAQVLPPRIFSMFESENGNKQTSGVEKERLFTVCHTRSLAVNTTDNICSNSYGLQISINGTGKHWLARNCAKH